MKLPFSIERPASEVPASYASDIDINAIRGVNATNVQQALEALLSMIGSGSGGSGESSPSATNDPISIEEYNAIIAKENRLYFIADGEGVLQFIYYKETLIAKRGETSSMSGFPLVFPYVFN